MILKLKPKPFITLCVISFLNLTPIASAKQHSLELLSIGEIRSLNVPAESKFTIGSNAVRLHLQKAHSRTDDLMIKAVKPGFASVVVLHKNSTRDEYRFWVQKNNHLHAIPSALIRILNELSGVEVVSVENKFWIRGVIDRSEDLFLLYQALEGQTKEVQIIPLIRLSDSLKSIVENKLEQELKVFKKESPSLRIETENDHWILKGVVKDPAVKEKIYSTLKHTLPILENELESFSTHSGTYHFQVFLLQIRRSGLRSLGMQWNESIAFSLKANPLQISRAEDLTPKLKMLESQGKVRILSQPEISVRAPGDAELFSGGEFPIRTQSRFISEIQWKNFGLLLKLKVLEAHPEGVRLDILTEMSHLDTQLSSDDVPALQTNRMKTSVDAVFYKPLLLSGLITDQTRENIRGIPGIRSIPIFGALFESNENIEERYELSAILVPRLTPPNLEVRPIGDTSLPKGPLPPLQSAPTNPELDSPWNAFYAKSK